jgi:hypothetical protein
MTNPKMTEEEKTKAYYDGCKKARKHNKTAKNTSPTLILVEKDDECNTRDEDTMLRYLDQKKEVIDWHASIRNLSSYGARTGYSMQHYKRCIDRWVSYFAPNMRPVTDQMDANEAASYLSSLTLPDNEQKLQVSSLGTGYLVWPPRLASTLAECPPPHSRCLV